MKADGSRLITWKPTETLVLLSVIKNAYSVQWIQGTLCFQGKRKLLKTPECKKHIQHSENFQGISVFSG